MSSPASATAAGARTATAAAAVAARARRRGGALVLAGGPCALRPLGTRRAITIQLTRHARIAGGRAALGRPCAIDLRRLRVAPRPVVPRLPRAAAGPAIHVAVAARVNVASGV